MRAPTPTVTAFFGIDDTSNVFVLDDAVKGLLDGATYVLGGDVGTDITPYVKVTGIERGRSRAIDEMNAGTASFTANNHTRLLDNEYASSPYVGMIKPGVQIIVAADGTPRFTGLLDDVDYSYPVSGDSTVNFEAADALATLASAEFDEWTTTDGQLVGARITDVLNRDEVGFPATRNIGAGSSTLQADLVSWGSNVLNYLQLVAKCDFGQLFVAKDGTLTFYGRNRVVTSVGAPLFSDDGTGIPFAGISIDYGTELLFNRVSVDATGFNKQTAVDDASIAEFRKIWSLSLGGLPLDTEDQALGLANYLLSLYSQPENRIASITILLHGIDSAHVPTVLGLDIGSVVRVAYTPNRIGAAIDKVCMIEGVSEEYAPEYHAITFHLSNLADGFGTSPFTLDDAEFGLLDGVGRLGF